MSWYMAKIVYRIVCGDGNHTPQFDEQLRLIEAEDGLHAFNKAQALGENEQDNFLNQEKALVQWKFINVSELNRIDRLADGVEMYSRIIEDKDADSFVHITHLKAAHLADRHAEHFLNAL